MASIFISYRRADSGGYAGRIFDGLQREFGSAAVFRDVDAISDGAKFPEAIRHHLETCRVFVLVIGPTWLTAKDENGRRRLDDPEDWVRLEVEAALMQIPCIIPVTVGGARMPAAKDLPEGTRALAERQARELRDGDTWDGDLELLTRRISRELGARPIRRLRQIALVVSGIALLGGLALWLPRFFTSRRPPPTRASFTSTPKIIWEVNNKEPVENQPSEPTRFVIGQPHFITYIWTYHWNNGKGSTAGRVSLQSADGQEIGRWEVRATAGDRGAPNVNWEAEPNIVIPAGTYTVVDSEPETWSQNHCSAFRGFAMIKGHPIDE